MIHALREIFRNGFNIGAQLAEKGTTGCQHEWKWHGPPPEERRTIVPAQGSLVAGLSFLYCGKCMAKFEFQQDDTDAKPCLCGQGYYGWTHWCPYGTDER